MQLITTVLAQGEVRIAPGEGGAFSNLTEFTFGSLVSFAINAVMIIAAILFFFMLVFGGIRWITSGGDKAGTESARSQVTAALIGLVIVFSAFVIVQLLLNAFGIAEDGFEFGTIQTGV